MKDNKYILIAASMVIFVFIIAIAIMSAFSSKIGFNRVSFGKQAQLRNTIEIALSDIDSLEVKYGSKNIYIYKGDSDKIVVKEYLIHDDQEAFADLDISNRVASVTGSRLSTFSIMGLFSNEKIEIYIPETGLENLMVTTGSGNITTTTGTDFKFDTLMANAGSGNLIWSNTTANSASFNTGSGNITVNEITANVTTNTGSGNVSASEITGSFDSGVGSGNINADKIDGLGAFETSSGNINIDFKCITGDISTKTGSGNIHVNVPNDICGNVTIKTGSGSIHTDFDSYLQYEKNDKKASGTIGNNASDNITISTGSGNIHLNKN